MLLGSEGILGVITEAWVRVRERPRFKLSRAVGFGSFAAGAEAVREIAQSGLHPSNCRLLDELEAEMFAGGEGRGDPRARLRVGAATRSAGRWSGRWRSPGRTGER